MKEEGRGNEVLNLSARTKDFALRVIGMFPRLPRNEVARVLGRQVLRSATSVGANYRESQRARSKAEFTAKIGDSLKELDETAYWLELIVESHLLPAAKLRPLRDECSELIAIFTTIAKRSKENP